MAGKAGARQFTARDKAEGLAVLAANGGLIKRAARDLSINPATLRRWRDEQKQTATLKQRVGGDELVVTHPAVPFDLVVAASGSFAERADRIRDKALAQLEAQIDSGLVSANHLVTIVGVLDDKSVRSRGLATEIVRQQTDRTPDEIRDLVGSAMQAVLAAAHRREMEIDGADLVEELDEQALPAHSSETSE